MLFTFLVFVLFGSSAFADVEYICEGNTLNISCPLFTTIHINSANYGRQNSTICPKVGLDKNINCTNKNTSEILQKRCDADIGNNCTLKADNQVFSDPCVGTYKYLEINYTCQRNKPSRPIGPLLPPKCGPNEVQGCVNPCNPTCQKKKHRVCSDICLFGCVCKQGYMKDNKTGTCVPKKYCPLPGKGCQTHEIFSQCNANCQRTCYNRDSCCDDTPCVPGYVCKDYFVRDTSTNRCVYPEECRRFRPGPYYGPGPVIY